MHTQLNSHAIEIHGNSGKVSLEPLIEPDGKDSMHVIHRLA